MHQRFTSYLVLRIALPSPFQELAICSEKNGESVSYMQPFNSTDFSKKLPHPVFSIVLGVFLIPAVPILYREMMFPVSNTDALLCDDVHLVTIMQNLMLIFANTSALLVKINKFFGFYWYEDISNAAAFQWGNHVRHVLCGTIDSIHSF